MIKDGKFEKPNPGINYKDGKLFLFEEERIVVMKIDEHGPRAWEKTIEEPFFKPAPFPQMSNNSCKLILNPLPEGEYIHWRVKEEIKFICAHVDYPIIKEMAKFESDPWQICALAMRANGLDLIQSNPAIAYITALNNVFIGKCKKPWRRARSLVGEKRKIILKKAGFKSSESVVKILSKIHPGCINKKTIFLIRWLLNSGNEEILKPIRFLPKINNLVFGLLGNNEKRSFVSYQLLEELSQVNCTFINEITYQRRINDMFRLANMLTFELPRNIRSMEQIDKIHDNLTDRLIDIGPIPSMKYHEFNSPLIQDFRSEACTIEHIKNTHELLEWGKRQHNCVLSYNYEIADGDIYIFRIKTRNEEATLSLIPNHDAGKNHFKIDQLLSKRNKEVKDETRQLVDIWMNIDKNYIKYWKKFPIPEVVNKDLIIKPQNNIEFIFDLPFHEFKNLGIDDIKNEQVFFYSIQKPESGVIALMKVNGQWDTALIRDVAGNDMKDRTVNMIEQWLWENTPEGATRQLKFDFVKKIPNSKYLANYSLEVIEDFDHSNEITA